MVSEAGYQPVVSETGYQSGQFFPEQKTELTFANRTHTQNFRTFVGRIKQSPGTDVITLAHMWSGTHFLFVRKHFAKNGRQISVTENSATRRDVGRCRLSDITWSYLQNDCLIDITMFGNFHLFDHHVINNWLSVLSSTILAMTSARELGGRGQRRFLSYFHCDYYTSSLFPQKFQDLIEIKNGTYFIVCYESKRYASWNSWYSVESHLNIQWLSEKEKPP